MTDTVKSWVEERRTIHTKATDGPWYKTPNDRILSEGVQWIEGDDYDVAGGFGCKGAVVEAIHDFDGNAIVDAHNMFPRALNALEQVLELHQPMGVFTGFVPVCAECADIGGGDVAWSCPSVQTIEGAINE